MDADILKIGRVIEVNGSKTIGELDEDINSLYRTYKSRQYAIGQLGSIVKIEYGDNLVFGIVTSLRMEEIDVDANNKDLSTDNKKIEIELIGEAYKTGDNEEDFEFTRGISNYPLPGQKIYIASIKELTKIYAKDETKSSFKIGQVSQAIGLPVHLNTDDLIGKHFAILGTTGSGKSCSVALILKNLIETYSKSHIVLLDPHNEYSKAFPESSNVINVSNLKLPFWLFNIQEACDIFIGKTEYQATNQINILKNAILYAKQNYENKPIDDEFIMLDTPVPYKLSDLLSYIDEDKPRNKDQTVSSKADTHIKIENKIEGLKSDKRFEFLFPKDEDISDNLQEIFSDILRIPVDDKPITILDLSGIPSDVVDVVISVLCRIIFDFALWNNEKRDELPLLLLCEEAHRYVSKSDDSGFKNTKKSLARIAKEGRKYGVGLGLVTQRPSELDKNILSQCNTIISLRMNNETDQTFVKQALPDTLRSLVDTLPALRTREALIVGEGINVPLRVFFDNLTEENRPQSENIKYSQAWSSNEGSLDDVKKVIENWRKQIK